VGFYPCILIERTIVTIEKPNLFDITVTPTLTGRPSLTL